MSSTTVEPFKVAIIKVYELEAAEIDKIMPESYISYIGDNIPNATFDIFRPLKDFNSLPEPGVYNLVVISGGLAPLSKLPHEPWIVNMIEWIPKLLRGEKTKLLGICWGHQIISLALSGKIGKFDVSRLGVEHLDLTEAGKAFFGKDKLAITKFHQHYVSQIPSNFIMLAPCNEILADKTGRILSFQGHPELSGEDSRAVMHSDYSKYYDALGGTAEALQHYYATLHDGREDADIIFKCIAVWASS